MPFSGEYRVGSIVTATAYYTATTAPVSYEYVTNGFSSYLSDTDRLLELMKEVDRLQRRIASANKSKDRPAITKEDAPPRRIMV